MIQKLAGNSIVFVCRAYNDIDHITPIAYKLKQTHPEIEIEIILYDVKNNFSDDFRLIFLQSIKISVFHILDLLYDSKVFHKSYFWLKKYQLGLKVSLCSLLLKILVLNPVEKFYNRIILNVNGQYFLSKYFSNLPKLIVFDQSYLKFYSNLCSHCRSLNIPTIAVPHGHNILSNELIWNESMDIYPSSPGLQGKMPYDYVIYENHIIAERYKKMMITTNSQAIVLGSSRFNDEWVKLLRTIIPKKYPNTPPDCKLKVVIMLSKPRYNGFTEELVRSINFISKFPNVFLVVKPHTRNKKFNHTVRNEKIFVDNKHQFDSPNLIDWADLVIFEHSCICFDSIKNDKPTLYLKSTHANKLMSESIFTSWEVNCRDDLRSFLWKMLHDKSFRTYTSEDAQTFCRTVIEPEGKDVLSNYVSFIMKIFNQSLNDQHILKI